MSRPSKSGGWRYGLGLQVTAKVSPKNDGPGLRTRDVAQELRLGVASGRPSHALLDAWPVLSQFADRKPALLASIIASASGPESASATGALVEGEAVAFGVIDRVGHLIEGSQQFRAGGGDPAESVDCLELVRRATADGRATGRVRTLRHGVLATLAVAGSSASPWPALLERQGMGFPHGGVLLVIFAPSRSHALIGRAADALGLSPLQRRIAVAMLDEPTLEAAALSLGIGRETARDALDGALQKAGARRASLLVGRLIELSCGLTEQPEGAAAGAALGLTPAEANVAARVADGDTVEEAAWTLGLRQGTVKSYRRSIFEKLGIHRSRDLKRLITEASELERLSGASEIGLSVEPAGAPRIMHDAVGRTVACLDYGPATGRPLVLMHGYWTGRLAPPPLLLALTAAGRRVIVPQRPGFGLTSAAMGDYISVAVADMALILDRLNCPRASVLARDGGVATALAFGAAFPERLESAVLLNPRRPIDIERRTRSPLTALSGMLLRHPALIEPYARMMLTQSRRDVVIGGLRRAFSTAPADRACFENPEVVDHLVADLMGLVGRTIRGPIAEQRIFSEGWRGPEPYLGPKWRLAFSGYFYSPGDEAVWNAVATGAPVILLDAGMLVQFTHAQAIAALFAN